MIVRLIAVDRIRSSYVAAACDDMRSRLSHYHTYQEIEVRAGDGSNPASAMRDEGERILKHVRPGEPVWLLDRGGMQLSSPQLSTRLDAVARDGMQRLTLVIAGTYGAAPALLERADFTWSLSQLTFLHEWARMLVLEQLYRAAKIARDEPYHH
ncbi:MAG TPA: 23S rRNA (pseudouridine(1915)-N(3))-methyltransferase RlmH [Candidatus Tumulicola sp.]|jgi:23S rRNA (pseudouridine1915-N3)-methyltransferase